ncbi:MAG: GGDEF domain-containing protein [Clostridia bacterium]|nr:GGDEF domain-containing protein [Clostridia bacterium]
MNKSIQKKSLVFKMLLTLMLMLVLTGLVIAFDIPNPNMILITGLVLSTSLFGYSSGIVAAIIMIVYSMWFFSVDHKFFEFAPINIQKMSVILLGTVLSLIFVGHVERRRTLALIALEEANSKLQKDNIKLEEVSSVDALTGLGNRYAIKQLYLNYKGSNLHVMMIDIDNLKITNDTHGHPVGDEMLKRVGAVLLDTYGKDRCFRYGGDEFLVVCCQMEHEIFLETLEQLKCSLAENNKKDDIINISLSAGYVYGDATTDGDFDKMIQQADEHLYNVKNNGRNHIEGNQYIKA